MITPTLAQLQRAIQISEQIESLQIELAGILSNGSAPIATSASVRVNKKGGMSAAGRARIAAAQKLRWAKAKGTNASAPAKPEAKKKGGLSEAGRKKLALSMKKRWAAAKAGKGPSPTAGKK